MCGNLRLPACGERNLRVSCVTLWAFYCKTRPIVRAFLADNGCSQGAAIHGLAEEWLTKNGQPFELMPPHQSGRDAQGNPTELYELGYVEALRQQVLMLSSKQATIGIAGTPVATLVKK